MAFRTINRAKIDNPVFLETSPELTLRAFVGAQIGSTMAHSHKGTVL